MGSAQDAATSRLSERLLVVVLDAFGDGEGGASVNLDMADESLLRVMAFLAALRPELCTPQMMRAFSNGAAERLNQLIPSARADHETSGIREHIILEQRVLS